MRESRRTVLRNKLDIPVKKEISPIKRLLVKICHSGKRAIIVEGKLDVRYHMWLRDRLGIGNVRVWYAGGKKPVLKLHKDKSKILDHEVPVAYVVDRDLEHLFSPNPKPTDIIWTTGYCIENDLYEGYATENLENLLEPNERGQYNKLRDSVIEWFAFEFEVFEKTGNTLDTKVGASLEELVSYGCTNVKASFLKKRGFKKPDQKTVDKFKSSYRLKLAGKLVFEMLARFLNDPNRSTRYPGTQTFTISQMYELAGKNTTNQFTTLIITKIEEELEKQENIIAKKKK